MWHILRNFNLYILNVQTSDIVTMDSTITPVQIRYPCQTQNQCHCVLTHILLHSKQPVEQVIPCFLQEQRMESQPDVQPQRTTSRVFWGVGCKSVMIVSKFPTMTFQSQSTEAISTPNHSWIWCYTLRLCYLTSRRKRKCTRLNWRFYT